MTTDRLSTIHHHAESIVSSTALIFNIILLYLIVRHSQFREKSNKYILLMSCIADMWLALVVFIGQPMVLAGRGWMILVANGFFATKSAFFDHISIAVYCASIHTSMVIVVIQFYCRYRIVCRSNDPKSSSMIWQFIAVCVLYCLTQATDATFTFVISATEEVRQLALEIMTENYGMAFENGTAPYPMMSHYSEWKAIVHHFFYLASSAGGYTLVIWCQSQIKGFTAQHGTSFRASTRKMNQDVNRALVALAITPLISLMGPTFFYIMQIMFDIRHHYTAFLSLFMSLITLMNPLATVYFVRPYRNAILQALGIAKVKSTPITVFSTTQANSSERPAFTRTYTAEIDVA